MAKVVVVDKNKCIGCGTCSALAPNVFELKSVDDKLVSVAKESFDFATEEKDILDAMDGCASGAIRVGEEVSGNSLETGN